MSDETCSNFDPVALSRRNFYPVIDIGNTQNVLDLTKEYDPKAITLDPPSIGRYNEKRPNMYNTRMYGGVRNIHIGIDIWVPAGTPVYAFSDGYVLFYRDNANPGDYGPTIVTEHNLEGTQIYALFGHLSRESLRKVHEGMPLEGGVAFTEVGDENENGGWLPHLHFQLSLKRPCEPDMPGVVSEDALPEALETWPDPQLVLGRLY